jgi:hypothetical protein
MLGKDARRDTGPALRPALLQIDHPLCYQRLFARPGEDDKLSNGKARTSRVTSPKPLTLEEKVTQLYETQQVIDVLNSYAYSLDSCMVDSVYSDDWAALFTDDCVVTYPFGTQNGRHGLAEFAMQAELRFYRMAVSLTIYKLRNLGGSGWSTILEHIIEA